MVRSIRPLLVLVLVLVLWSSAASAAALPPYLPPPYLPWVSGGATFNSPVAVSTQAHFYDTSRLSDTVPTRSDVACERFGWPNWNAGASGESTPAGPVTISASIELNPAYSGTTPWSIFSGTNVVYPLTFSGAKTTTIPANGFVLSDPLCVPIPAGSLYYVRTWRQSLAGTISTLPVDRYMDLSRSDVMTDGYFNGVALGSSTTATVNPSGTLSATYVGLPLAPGTITLSGTNISAPVTDVNQNNGTGSFSGNGITNGTVTYATGAISLTMVTATAPNAIFAKGQGYSGVAIPDQTMVPTPSGFVGTYQQYGVFGPSLAQFRYAPNAVKQPFTLGAEGDSIDFGYGSQYYTQSWVTKTVANAYGIVKTAQPSITTGPCATTTASWRRQSLMLSASPVDRLVLNTATNDLAAGTALATIQTNIAACVQQYAKSVKGGIANIYVATVLPHTASASSNAPYSAAFGPGSVASGSPSARNAYNAWLFTQIGTLWAGVIDTSSCVEGNPASQAGAGDGTWKSLSLTYDGLHPSELGHQTIAACPATTSSPAFLAP